MNVEDTFRETVKKLYELEEWDTEKVEWYDWWEERARWSYERLHSVLPNTNMAGFRLTTTLMYAIPDLGEFIERFLEPFDTKTIMFKNLRHRLQENQEPTRIRPSQHKGTPPQIVRTYLRNTPFRRLFDAEVEVVIPFRKRFAHMWFCAHTDAGKSTPTQWMIERDLEWVGRGKCSIILIESKGELIDWLAHHPFFREHPDRLVYITPRDPIAINPFQKRGGDSDEFFAAKSFMKYLASGIIGGAEFSANHETIYSNCMELLWQGKAPTVKGLLDILYTGPKGLERNLSHTDEEVRRWFRNEWPGMADRAKETRARLFNVLRVPAFRDMLRPYRSTFNLTTQLDIGKVICIHANKGALGDEVRHYGRFFIALLEKASRDRSHEDYRGPKLPTFAYIDEASDFIKEDTKIEEMLDQARGQNIGLVIAHQRLGHLSPGVIDALKANVQTKLMRLGEETNLARGLRFKGEFGDLPDNHFVLHVMGHIKNGVPVKFAQPSYDRISEDEYQGLRQESRKAHGIQQHEPQPNPEEQEGEPEAEPEPIQADPGPQPWTP